jgi:predicted DNA-binding transcriptional regulator YafY
VRDYEDRQADRDIVNLTAGRKDNGSRTGRKVLGFPQDDQPGHGRLLFTADYTDMDNLVTWLMTFGAKAEVLEPAEAREIIRRNAEETLKIYMEE